MKNFLARAKEQYGNDEAGNAAFEILQEWCAGLSINPELIRDEDNLIPKEDDTYSKVSEHFVKIIEHNLLFKYDFNYTPWAFYLFVPMFLKFAENHEPKDTIEYISRATIYFALKRKRDYFGDMSYSFKNFFEWCVPYTGDVMICINTLIEKLYEYTYKNRGSLTYGKSSSIKVYSSLSLMVYYLIADILWHKK